MGRTVGVLGGGQLGRMMGFAAHRLGVRLIPLETLGADSPAGQVTSSSLAGAFRDADKIKELSEMCEVLTVEIEHVDTTALDVAVASGVPVHPSPLCIRIIQDKFKQKELLIKHGIPVAKQEAVGNVEETRAAALSMGFPCMLKQRTMAYDGRGCAPLNGPQDIEEAFANMSGSSSPPTPLYLEQWVPFTKELAVMVARSTTGEMAVYPLVETVQRDGICHTVTAPAQGVSLKSRDEALKIAKDAVACFKSAGIFGVEMFLLPDGSISVNELAPRPHNSGHYTIEACETDQFEQHLRAVLGLPLGSTRLKVGAAMMINVLGESRREDTLIPLTKALSIPGAGLHWYGKASHRLGQKLGHITVVASSVAELFRRVAPILPAGAERPPEEKRSTAEGVLVGIIMGSDSDLPTMQAAAQVLEQFGVPFELTVVSAHRTPDRMFDYAKAAKGRGLKTIIAGAGGAAHLPGMIAALTPLPVIGVPVKSSTLSGQDSLLSIVQMPRGVPVATVAIGNSMNAGLLAVRLLAAFDEQLMAKLEAWHASQADEVLAKADRLERLGHEAYLAGGK
eukprot:gb/GEZN01002965.1/.p1 GENE.gb/GEZN01002965.1/~~gb/GEZN01002965.1/.p1  ORF type:complete len:615 (+),score=132.45 gb/GEZN01002965.1/:151-1845(+)